MPDFHGRVVSNNRLSLRFPESGKVKYINCFPGQIVKKGEVLISLDSLPVQIFLDIELSDYKRIRAEFDQLSRVIPTPKTEDEKTKKEIAQSKLDVSVKNVEKYKHLLDSYTLYAPCDCIIDDMSGLYAGVQVTANSNPISVIPTTSAVLEIILSEDELTNIYPGRACFVTLKNQPGFESEVTFISPTSNKDGNFTIHLKLPPLNLDNFRIGSSGKVSFT